MALTKQTTVPTSAGAPFPPRLHTASPQQLPSFLHLHLWAVQWEQHRLSFPEPQDSAKEQSSRSQWGTPAWCRMERY